MLWETRNAQRNHLSAGMIRFPKAKVENGSVGVLERMSSSLDVTMEKSLVKSSDQSYMPSQMPAKKQLVQLFT